MESLKMQTEIAIEELIDYCRNREIDFRKGISNKSGVEHLINCLNKKIISMEMYINILPAVTNPENEYKINITKDRNNDKN